MFKTYFTISCIAILFLAFSGLKAGNYAPRTPLSPADSMTASGKRVYITQRFNSEPPRIDGVLDDDCWKEGFWSGNYLQQTPVEGAKPSEKTDIKILYDDKNIYVAIRAFETDVNKIDRQRGRRDDFIGDIIGVCFDSYYDKRTGFEFDMTAGGSKLDVQLKNDGWDTNWNAVWEGKVGMEDSAWIAEYRIPLSQLRYSGNKEQIWGLHSWRWINRNQEEDEWNLIPRDNPGLMRSIGELHGIKDIPKSRRIELLPYTLGQVKFSEKEIGNPYATGFDKRMTLGVDAKIGISSDFTLDLTVNPDFGQVEADPAVLNLTAFETFFEEKRPFFLEGKNITDFDFGEGNLFYSRRIGQSHNYQPELDSAEYAQSIQNTAILGAAKVTGKTKDGLSVGIINALTAKETIKKSTPEGEEKLVAEPLSDFFVGRVQKDINGGNTLIGGIITNTSRMINETYLENMPERSNTGGIDFTHNWNDKKYFIDAKAVFSLVKGSKLSIATLQNSSARYFQRPDAEHLHLDSTLTSFSGYGGQVTIGKKSGGKFRYNLHLNFRSPELELNEIGFLSTVDQIIQVVNTDYVVTEPKGNVREYSLHLGQTNVFDFGGQYLSSSINFNSYFKFENMWYYNISYNRYFDQTDTRLLRGGPAIYTQGFHCASASFHSNESLKVSYGFNYHFHIFDSGLSNQNDFSPNITWRALPSLKFSVDGNYSLLTSGFQYVDDNYADKYFMASLYQKTLGLTLRVDYTLTPELTFQYYGNPYISVGEYSQYKIITDADSKTYDKLYHQFTDNETAYNADTKTYTFSNVDQQFEIANPDFNFQQFKSNFVVRWEYKTGSTFYFVWSHGRSQYDEITNMSMRDNINHLVGLKAENLFLVKFNYWLSL